MSQDYDLIDASESDGSTVVEFSRDAVTGDNAKDVQFKVWSFWCRYIFHVMENCEENVYSWLNWDRSKEYVVGGAHKICCK